MATFTGNVYSHTLQMRTGLNLVTPAHLDYGDPSPLPVVYLLHGLTDAHTCWSDNAQLPLFAEEYGVIFLIPEVQRSFYTDMEYGLPYYRYITDELPIICKKLFGITGKREDSYIAGLSMGGYGALKCALDKPERYAGCAAFSSACDLKLLLLAEKGFHKEAAAICGTNLQLRPQDDLFQLAENCRNKENKPKLYMTCGLQDPLRDMNLSFYKRLEQMEFPIVYEEWKGGHDWYFWNESLHRALAYLFKEGD